MASQHYSRANSKESDATFFSNLRQLFPGSKKFQQYIWGQVSSGLTTISPPNPSTIKIPDPNIYYLKSVIIWVPEWHWRPFFPHENITCPCCNQSKHTEPKEYVTRHVILDDDWAVLLGRRYKCRTCFPIFENTKKKNKPESSKILFTEPSENADHETDDENNDPLDDTVDDSTRGMKGTFNTWDEGVLENLPSFIRRNFQFLLTKRSGILKTIVDSIVNDVINGKSFKAAQGRLSHQHRKKYFNSHIQYLSSVK